MAHRQGSTVIDEGDVHVTSVLTKRHEHAVLEDNANLDEATLGALGYKQEFKRQGLQSQLVDTMLTTRQRLLHF